MNNILTIDQLKDSTVNQEVLRKEFIEYLPRRLDEVMDMFVRDNNEDFYDYMTRLYATLDSIDYHYRRFLKGYSKTLHRVFYEFRQLPLENIMLGLSVIYEVDNILVVNEFYEMMNKHNQAKDRIQKLILKLNKNR